MVRSEVQAYYGSAGEREWTRLDKAEGVIEYAVTCHAMETYLPAGGRVLDIGGGPGRYSLWLAQRGYQVVLADVTSELLRIAEAKLEAAGVRGQVEIVTGDACDLSSWPAACFDAVLSLGPFYHLTTPSDRAMAVAELVRVLRPGGVALIAVMPSYTFLRRTIADPDERHHLADPVFMHALLDEGVFRNDQPDRFTQGFGMIPSEISPYFERYGLCTRNLLACEGLASGLEEEIAALAVNDPTLHEMVLNLVVRTANDPSLFGTSSHLLYIGQRVLAEDHLSLESENT